MPGKDIDDIWEGDLLGRKDDGMYLQRFIENSYRMDTAHQNSFVLNINSEWGSGKTWFLERFAKQLKQNHPVVYFDAWKNDFTQDPLTSLIAVICQSMEEQFSGDLEAKNKVALVKKNALKFIKPSLPVVLAALAKRYSGVDLFEEVEEGGSDVSQEDVSLTQDVSSTLTKIAATEAMNNFYKQKKGIDDFIDAIKSFVTHLSDTGNNSYLPICIFIDELDRCRPTYAIELLEAVKHIFSIGGLFFIIATDSKQLAHSINAVYGQNFDSLSYLKRFFYTEYSLSAVNYKKMATHLISGFDFGDKIYLPSKYVNEIGIDGYFSENSRFFQLTPREQEQVFINFKNCILSSEYNKIHFGYLLFLVALKLKHQSIYEELMKSKDSKSFSEFMKSKGARGSAYALSGLTLSGASSSIKNDPQKLDIPELIEFYLKIRGFNFGELIKKSFNYLYQDEIIREISKERGRLVRNNEDEPSTEDYFFLISQAGRLIKNI
jgi:hypothetical protein